MFEYEYADCNIWNQYTFYSTKTGYIIQVRVCMSRIVQNTFFFVFVRYIFPSPRRILMWFPLIGRVIQFEGLYLCMNMHNMLEKKQWMSMIPHLKKNIFPSYNNIIILKHYGYSIKTVVVSRRILIRIFYYSMTFCDFGLRTN